MLWGPWPTRSRTLKMTMPICGCFPYFLFLLRLFRTFFLTLKKLFYWPPSSVCPLTPQRRERPRGPWIWGWRCRSSSLLCGSPRSLRSVKNSKLLAAYSATARQTVLRLTTGGAAVVYLLTMRCHKIEEIGEWKLLFQLNELYSVIIVTFTF